MAYTTINKGSSYFDTSLWTGTGATQSITSLNFQPDWLWVKTRSTAANHRSQNSVTGVTKGMNPNQTSAEDTLTDCVTSFNSNGFTLGVDSQGYVNVSSRTYVGWSWLASNTTVANTSGTISSTVSVNQTAGFSIVSYTGTGSVGNIGHGLGVAPKMIIKKKRSGADAWNVWHTSIGDGSKALFLNLNNAIDTNANYASNVPTSSLFYVGTDSMINGSGATYIAYCFAEIKGYSKFSSYVGNGSADGTFIYTGFKPAYVMVKASSTTGQWAICDNKRGAANILNNNGEFLFAETNDATNSAPANWDFLSNGFKARANYAAHNSSGVTYIYMAFAENPFVSSTQIPTTAR